ncbi:hypothetical protein KA005_79755, partial [bacterium]|nr:hypothetical protein [bacterium]
MLKNRTGKIILGGIIMLKKTFILTLISVLLIGTFSPLFGPEILVFGPKQYTRNKGKPVTETDNFTSSITGPNFTLRVINGDAQGDHRVSSGTITLNGEQVVGPSDFNQQVEIIERTVTINSSNEISVKLTSAPNSYITISIIGIAPEPTVSISASPTNILLGESSTLTWSTSNAQTVNIDQGIGSVDLNGSIDVSPTETTTYTVTATGYGGTATAGVTINVLVDQTPPSITINSPESGAQYDSLPISVLASYEDSGSGINQSSVKVTLNGNDITSELTVTESGVNGGISNEALLQDGNNTLIVEVSDNAGNSGSESVYFNYEKIQEENKTIIYGRVFEAGSENPLSGAIITSSGN